MGQDLPVLAAIGTAVAALIIAPFVQFHIGRKQAAAAHASARASLLAAENAGRHAIARSRQEWINALRGTVSEFHAILMTVAEYPYPAHDDRKLSELGTRIELFLNPEEPESQRLLSLMAKVYATPTCEEREKYDGELIAATQGILKKEWERMKAELQVVR